MAFQQFFIRRIQCTYKKAALDSVVSIVPLIWPRFRSPTLVQWHQRLCVDLPYL